LIASIRAVFNAFSVSVIPYYSWEYFKLGYFKFVGRVTVFSLFIYFYISLVSSQIFLCTAAHS